MFGRLGRITEMGVVASCLTAVLTLTTCKRELSLEESLNALVSAAARCDTKFLHSSLSRDSLKRLEVVEAMRGAVLPPEERRRLDPLRELCLSPQGGWVPTVEIESVSSQGDRAVVLFRMPSQGEKGRVVFVQEGGAWKLDLAASIDEAGREAEAHGK